VEGADEPVLRIRVDCGWHCRPHPVPAISVTLLGLTWIIAFWRDLPRIAAPAFGIFILISVVGIWGGVSAWLSLAGVVFSLAAWDLTMFIQRLNMTNALDDRRKMEQNHFIHLALVVGLGVLGFVASTLLRVNLTFGGAAILALLGIWGISALVYRLRRHEDEVNV
jgi:hypothetical protein